MVLRRNDERRQQSNTAATKAHNLEQLFTKCPQLTSTEIPAESNRGSNQLRIPMPPVQVLDKETHETEIQTPTYRQHCKVFTRGFKVRFFTGEG